MNVRIRERLNQELSSRGFKAGNAAPNETMVFDDAFLDATDLGELLETMVARREKIWRSYEVVGTEPATKSYEDVTVAIEAIKDVIKVLILP